MGIFGNLDADKIPDNPFFVGEGSYTGIIAKAFFYHSDKKDKDQLVIEYKITDADDEENERYKNKVVRDWFDYFPDLTEDDLEDLPPAERGKVEGALSAIKRRLCGFKQGRTFYPGLGVELEDLDESWDPKSLIDSEVFLAVVNTGDSKEFSNVKWVRRVDLEISEEAD